jgi:hypothetical protein
MKRRNYGGIILDTASTTSTVFEKTVLEYHSSTSTYHGSSECVREGKTRLPYVLQNAQ